MMLHFSEHVMTFVSLFVIIFIIVVPRLQFFYILFHTLLSPSVRSSMAFLTPRSKARASAGLWNVRPHFLLSTRQ